MSSGNSSNYNSANLTDNNNNYNDSSNNSNSNNNQETANNIINNISNVHSHTRTENPIAVRKASLIISGGLEHTLEATSRAGLTKSGSGNSLLSATLEDGEKASYLSHLF